MNLFLMRDKYHRGQRMARYKLQAINNQYQESR